MGEHLRFSPQPPDDGLTEAQRKELERLRNKHERQGIRGPRNPQPPDNRPHVYIEEDGREGETPGPTKTPTRGVTIMELGGVGGIRGGGSSKRIEPIKPMRPTGEKPKDQKDPKKEQDSPSKEPPHKPAQEDELITYDRQKKLKQPKKPKHVDTKI